MEETGLNSILLEFKKLNERLDQMDEKNDNKFALIDARFNTLEEIVLSIQDDQYRNLEQRIRKNEIKIAKLSLSSC